ncbi:MAG: DUF4418 family protein [Lachnospiraceae bacterium]|nr:DUF4418 family protein [Lachnospiraceae bacterium]
MKKDRSFITGIALIAETLLLTIGTKTFLSPCKEPKEDGSWMYCHYAGTVVFGLAAAMLVMSVLFLLEKNSEAKKGVALSMLPCTILAVLIPQRVIPLCMMETMRCHTVFKPAVWILGILILITAVIAIYSLKKPFANR